MATASRVVQAFLAGVVVAATACVGSEFTPSGDPGVPTQPGADGGDGATPVVGPDANGTTDGASDGASDTGTVAETAGPWTPAQITGLVLWLDADAVTPNVNGVADAWNDKSTFKNNATTASDAQKPVVLTGASAINGHQALRFDGATKFFTIADSASLRWTQSFVIEAVFRHAQATASEDGPIFSKVTATALNNPKGPSLVLAALLGSPHAAYAEIGIGSPTFVETDKNTGYAPGVAHRLRAAWDFGTSMLSIQIDKTTPVSAVANGVTGLDAVGHDVLIGNGPDNFHLNADLAEVVAIAGATVAPADVTQLQSYLDKKYGL